MDVRRVRIACPICGAPAASARARDLRQTVLLFFVVPMYHHRPTLVNCACGASLVSRLKARDLEGLDPQFAQRFLYVRVSPVLKTLVLGGIIAWLLPVIGTVWMGIAYAWARRYSGWIRTLALVLLLLSLFPTAVVLFDDSITRTKAVSRDRAP